MQLHAINEDCFKHNCDIVFIHGLGGHPFSTWAHSGELSDSLPYWLAEKIVEAKVWTYEYDAAPSRYLGTSMPLADRSKATLEYFVQYSLGNRPIVFIAHSLGGLVVKQMLRDSSARPHSAWAKIARSTRGVSFVATPHNGSLAATFLKKFGTALGLTESVAELERNDAALRDLNEWFRNYQEYECLSVSVLMETRPWKGVLVVDQAAACGGFSKCDPVPVDANHITICKPTRRDALVTLSVVNFAKRCFTGACDNPIQYAQDNRVVTIVIDTENYDIKALQIFLECLQRISGHLTIQIVSARKKCIYLDLSMTKEAYDFILEMSMNGRLKELALQAFGPSGDVVVGPFGAFLDWKSLHPDFYNGENRECRLRSFTGMEEIAASVKQILPAETTNPEDASIYIGRFYHRGLYLQTNYRDPAYEFPAKIVTTEKCDVVELTGRLLGGGVSSRSNCEDLHIWKVHYFIDPSLKAGESGLFIDLQGATRVTILSHSCDDSSE